MDHKRHTRQKNRREPRKGNNAVAGQTPLWQAKVFTLYPEMFPGILDFSLPGKARKSGIWALEVVDIRRFARDKHRSVDDTPFGGGPGMVLRPDVIDTALEAEATPQAPMICLSPRGRPLDQDCVRRLAQEKDVTFLCGRFEGIDERVLEKWDMEEISLGDFILSGGEPAATALIDACVRLLPGVIGSQDALVEESFEGGLLEYPHYTRPQNWKGREVPEVLLSGHHEKIRDWRLAMAEEITHKRRPDLWARYVRKKL